VDIVGVLGVPRGNEGMDEVQTVTTSLRVRSSSSIASCNVVVRWPELGSDGDVSSANENDADIRVSGRGVLTSRCRPMGRARWRNGQGGDALVLRQSLARVVPADSDVEMRISSSTWDASNFFSNLNKNSKSKLI
jgi:hypothetical protein